jgi:hypothetical protein
LGAIAITVGFLSRMEDLLSLIYMTLVIFYFFLARERCSVGESLHLAGASVPRNTTRSASIQ